MKKQKRKEAAVDYEEICRKEREIQREKLQDPKDRKAMHQTFPKTFDIAKYDSKMLKRMKGMFDEAGLDILNLTNTKGETIQRGEVIASLIRNEGDVIKAIKELDVKNAFQFAILFENSEELLKLEDFYRSNLVRKAEHEIVGLLKSDNERIRLETAQFILKTLGARKGWYAGPEINIDVRTNTQEELRRDICNIFGIPVVEELPNVAENVVEARFEVKDHPGMSIKDC